MFAGTLKAHKLKINTQVGMATATAAFFLSTHARMRSCLITHTQ